ncbi:MAG TPA: mechanosensitive ion channel family protein [Methanomassiliicoccales archaeon]|jgi:small-conductance mechanosensitive channel
MAEVFGIDLEGLVYFSILIFLSLSVGRLAYAIFRRGFDTRIGKRRSKLIARWIQYAIIAAGLSFGMITFLNIDFTTVAAGIGLVGIVIALASQQILQNFMAGILMGLERQIQLEDWVDIGGTPETKPARVKDITLTKTVLLDPQGKFVVVPNSVIVSSKVINYTKAGFFEVPLRLTLSPEEDIDRVTRIILDVADKNPFILPNVPGEEKKEIDRLMHLRHLRILFEGRISYDMFRPRVLVSDIADAKITLSIRIWIREVNRRDDIVSGFLSDLFLRLHEASVKLA